MIAAFSQVLQIPLGDLCDVEGGNSAPQGEQYFCNGTVPFVRMRDLGRYRKTTCLDQTDQKVNDQAIRSKRLKIFEPGCILFPRSGSVALNHRAVLGTRACIVSHIGILQNFRANIVPRYLYWFLVSYDMSQIAKQTTNLDLVNFSDIRRINVPVPPLEEQQRIVAEIEKQFTRLDAGVGSLKRIQAALKRYRASVLKAACEGRLVATEAELARNENRRYETGEELLQRILKDRRERWNRKGKYKEPMMPHLPADEELPEGWAWASWDQVALSQNGRPFRSAEYQRSGFKLLRPGNLHISGKVVWTNENTRYMPQCRADENRDLIVRGRELIMNLTAQSLRDEFLGRVCLTSKDEECLLNQRLARLTPIIILPEFALYLLKAWHFRRFVDQLNTGSLIQHMFTSQLAEFTFPLPSLAEQQRIVAELERRLSLIEHIDAVAIKTVERVARLREAALARAFTMREIDR